MNRCLPLPYLATVALTFFACDPEKPLADAGVMRSVDAGIGVDAIALDDSGAEFDVASGADVAPGGDGAGILDATQLADAHRGADNGHGADTGQDAAGASDLALPQDGAAGLDLVARADAQVTVDGSADDDAASDAGAAVLPVVTASAVDVNEVDSPDSSQATFVISLSDSSEEVVGVDYEILAVTALAGVDYLPVQGTLNIAPGDLDGSIEVTVLGDLEEEGDETFVLVLSNPAHAVFDLETSFECRIVDNDHDPEGRLQVPVTGQSQCFDDSGDDLTCADSRHDGEYQDGQGWPVSRFTDHGDGTVTDGFTGLMWLKTSDCIGSIHPDLVSHNSGRVFWQQGLDFVAAMNADSVSATRSHHCGTTVAYDDWRVPNRNELSSLVDFGQEDPSLPAGHPFTLPPRSSVAYWSSTSTAYDPSMAWYQVLGNGDVFLTQKDNTQHRVWPVRLGGTTLPTTGQGACYDQQDVQIHCGGTGQDGDRYVGIRHPVDRFTDHGDGTVTDTFTGLMWLAGANCIGALHPTFDTDLGAGTEGDGLVTWQHALDFVGALNDGTYGCELGTIYTDWRIPNVRQLETLLDLGQAMPALPDGHPFVDVPDQGESQVWSSTSSQSWTDQAWRVSTVRGEVGWHDKVGRRNLAWPVRIAQ